MVVVGLQPERKPLRRLKRDFNKKRHLPFLAPSLSVALLLVDIWLDVICKKGKEAYGGWSWPPSEGRDTAVEGRNISAALVKRRLAISAIQSQYCAILPKETLHDSLIYSGEKGVEESE